MDINTDKDRGMDIDLDNFNISFAGIVQDEPWSQKNKRYNKLQKVFTKKAVNK